jgi:hypothetical protein
MSSSHEKAEEIEPHNWKRFTNPFRLKNKPSTNQKAQQRDIWIFNSRNLLIALDLFVCTQQAEQWNAQQMTIHV